jgi:hypothetical protein
MTSTPLFWRNDWGKIQDIINNTTGELRAIHQTPFNLCFEQWKRNDICSLLTKEIILEGMRLNCKSRNEVAIDEFR